MRTVTIKCDICGGDITPKGSAKERFPSTKEARVCLLRGQDIDSDDAGELLENVADVCGPCLANIRKAFRRP